MHERSFKTDEWTMPVLYAGANVYLSHDEHAAYTYLVRAKRKDGQTCIHNLLKYGTMEPTKDDFATFREAEKKFATPSALVDQDTGYELVALETLFTDLHSSMSEVIEHSSKSGHKTLRMLEELKRRILYRIVTGDVTVRTKEEQLTLLLGMIEHRKSELDTIGKTADRLTDQISSDEIRHAALQENILELRNKRDALAGELPSIIKSDKRKIEL